MSVSPRQHIRSMDDVKRVNEHLGGHFFDPDTLRWFNSRISDAYYAVTTDVDGPGGAVGYFVTSERDDAPYSATDHKRLYSVRRFTCARIQPGDYYYRPERDGDHKQDIETIDFQEHATLQSAKRAAERYAADDKARIARAEYAQFKANN